MAAARSMYTGGGGGGSAAGTPTARTSNIAPFNVEPGSDKSQTTPAGTPAGTTDAAAASAAVPGLEEGEAWIQCFDDESGWPYIYNQATGEMRWVDPETTDQLTAVLWEVYYDENGNIFYYNQVCKCPCTPKFCVAAVGGAVICLKLMC
jgi:hypothetical protein